ncbi:MAG: DNA-formamidopyrimidine glycosylase family protein [Pirellulales bacterium]|nr:DNA-formamidopyrimidine glycosylase family protein [Pirellulales bacterium]
MPELPEVETMRRGLLPLTGQVIRRVRLLPCERRPLTITPAQIDFCRSQTGQKIIAIERLGKRVILRLANELALVIEPRMTGLLLLADPPTADHLRVRWECVPPSSKRSGPRGKTTSFWYWDRRGLGVLRLVTPAQFAAYYGPQRIGPDALQLSPVELRARLQGTSRPIKVALLDQKLLAGVGNLYASEMLHLAKIHPAVPCDCLRGGDWSRLHAALVEVLETAIRYEGSTLGDGTYRNVLNQDGGYQNEHRVYARHKELCPACQKAAVVRIVQAQRATFFCPRCQRARGVKST